MMEVVLRRGFRSVEKTRMRGEDAEGRQKANSKICERRRTGPSCKRVRAGGVQVCSRIDFGKKVLTERVKG